MSGITKFTFMLSLMLWTALVIGGAQAEDQIRGPFIGPAVKGIPTVALSSLPKAAAGSKVIVIPPRVNPLANEPDQGKRGTWSPAKKLQRGADAKTAAPSRTPAPAPVRNFAGQGNTCGCSPPDTVGDVGPNHYVQMVNATQIAIYNKAGSILPGYPKEMNDLFASGNCAASNRGDPVVLYDSLADRWLLAQFTAPGFNGVCVAISQTPDPTGAYFGYEFLTPNFPDYLKFGVWPDGYYMSTNESTYAAYAFDRNRMLSGLSSISIRFDGVSNFMMPSDLDGKTPPPPGSPNYFYTFKDDLFHGGTDRLEIREFDVDFVTPANSTFILTDSIDITPFTYTVCGFFNLDCIPQGGTAQKVDPVSEWPMFRFPYRNYGTHEAMAGTFTIEGTQTDTGAVYWFELRNSPSGWTLRQQGKIDSNDGVSRWIGSIAMDAVGNLALGYSVSSAAMFPAIRYSVHRITDALGTMGPERALVSGAGSQTASNRWGDYAAMSIDPADDATFWFTSEYYTASSGNTWATRIGAFRVLNTRTFRSVAANDGYIVETSEVSGTGGALNSTANVLRFGDTASDRQLRSIVDFDTSSLPDTAVVTKAVLRLKQAGAVTGTDPFTTHGSLRGDIKKGAFSGNIALQSQDFQALSNLPNAVVIGPLRFASLSAAALVHIDRAGHTQFRLRHNLDDNDDLSADIHNAYSGEAAFVSTRPALEVTYFVP